MAGLRIIALAGAVTLAIAAGVAPALAGNDMCAPLEARLALLNGGAGSLGNANLDLDRTILNQRLAYDRLNLAAQRSGCLDGPISQGRRLGQSCGPLLTTIRQMTANLIQLEAEQRRTSVNPFTAARDRASVLRQLAMNQCSGQYAAYGYPDMQRRPLVASLFGSSAVRNDFGPDGFDYFGQSNTYRTLCVRTCDGYYFPVSFSTVPEKFASDEQSCQSLCPGTPVALYVYRNPGADIDAMVSLDGRPYTALPTAFKFRKQFDAACSCHASATPATRFAPLPIPVKPSADAILTIPSGRPAEGNADAVARGASEAAGKDDPANDDSAPADKPVRIVGPSYYVAQ